jgi:hypothetical protein
LWGEWISFALLEPFNIRQVLGSADGPFVDQQVAATENRELQRIDNPLLTFWPGFLESHGVDRR